MPLAANALTTVENVQAFAQGVGEIIPPEHALTIEFMINSTSEKVEKHCRRKFAKATYTSELHTGLKGQKIFYPHQWPIVSVASVKVDGTAITEDTDFTDGIDSSKWVKYKPPGGVWEALYREGTWLSEPMRLEITYDAGFVLPWAQLGTRDFPYDLEEYVMRLVLAEYIHRGKQGLTAESYAGLTLNFDRWPLDILNGLRMEKRPLV